jgi:hypothetical protein
MRTALTLLALALATTACATTGGRSGPTEVTRYHLGSALTPGAVTVEPLTAAGAVSGPEYQTYADAVTGELARVGFAPAAAGTQARYVAGVSFQRTARGQVRTPPRFSIGLGGGSFGRGGGLGGGVSTGFGSKTRDVLSSELHVQLRRRSDGTVVWEGRAQRTGLSGPDNQPGDTAQRLAAALMKGFPGESGITTSVP